MDTNQIILVVSIMGLIVAIIGLIKKFSPNFLSDKEWVKYKANWARQKMGRVTCIFVGHNFVHQEIDYPEIRGFHLYSECVSCGKRKDEETIPYEEMARRNKNKSP